MPVVPASNRPEIRTTTHLERTPGWIQVFRSVRSAVYLRDAPRNRENLERVAAYYEREGVPFDAAPGFDTDRVIREAPEWSFEHGLVPAQLQLLEAAARSPDPVRGPPTGRPSMPKARPGEPWLEGYAVRGERATIWLGR